MLPSSRFSFLLVNVVGGVAVLGSYAHGLLSYPDPSIVWGGVPAEWKPVYSVSMWTAAFGYFPFTLYLLSRAENFSRLNVLYTAILVPSALWMPLTFSMLAAPGAAKWILVRVVLALVGLASLALFRELVRFRKPHADVWFLLATAGLIAFSFQTAILDATVWPWYFPA